MRVNGRDHPKDPDADGKTTKKYIYGRNEL
jgi:hypothetical protein